MAPWFGTVNATAWGWAFLRHLRRELRTVMPQGASAVVRRTAASARTLFDEERSHVPDGPGLTILAMSTLLLAGWRELEDEGLDEKAPYETVRRAFLASFALPARWSVGALLSLSRDPVAVLSGPRYLRLLRGMFGTGIGFEQHVDTDRVVLVVTRCAFNRFFVEHEAPMLTRIVCEWDRVWMDQVNRSRRPIRMERPQTISTGCERCEFHHVRAMDRSGPALDIVLEPDP